MTFQSEYRPNRSSSFHMPRTAREWELCTLDALEHGTKNDVLNPASVRRSVNEARRTKSSRRTDCQNGMIAALEAYDAAHGNTVRFAKPKKVITLVGAGKSKKEEQDLQELLAKMGPKEMLPSEQEDTEELEYIDDDRLLPREQVNGCVVTLVGARSTHKTGLCIKFALDAIEKGERVLYIATEGGHGIGKARMPEARKYRAMSSEKTQNAWRLETHGILLCAKASRDAIVEVYRNFNPTLVIIDVLMLAVPGVDVYHAAEAGKIMGAAYELSRAFNCATVVLTNHPKRGGEENIGSVMFGNLVFTELQVTADSANEVKLFVAKMKDGPADRVIRYPIIKAGNGVPVIGPSFGESLKAAVVDPTVARNLAIVEAIKAMLDVDGAKYDKAELIVKLKANGHLPADLKRPEVLIRALVDDGLIGEEYVAVEGTSKRRRYTFFRHAL